VFPVGVVQLLAVMLPIPHRFRLGLGILTIGAVMIFGLVFLDGLLSLGLGALGTVALALGTLLVGLSGEGRAV